jgi:hypothetical protein
MYINAKWQIFLFFMKNSGFPVSARMISCQNDVGLGLPARAGTDGDGKAGDFSSPPKRLSRAGLSGGNPIAYCIFSTLC